MTQSTEANYMELPLAELGLDDVSFDDFAYLQKDEIEELCKKVPFKHRVKIRRIWTEHPNQTAKQGKCSFFGLIHCFTNTFITAYSLFFISGTSCR
jgi:hypothetical protein